MATSTIGNNVIKENVTNVMVPTRADTYKVIVRGHVAQICINNVKFANSISTDTIIGSVNYKPKEITRFLGHLQDGTVIRGHLATNGNLYLSYYIADRLMYCSFTYII